MNSGLLSVLTASYISSLFATSFSGTCWPDDRMQDFDTLVLASFFKPEAPSVCVYSQWLWFLSLSHDRE